MMIKIEGNCVGCQRDYSSSKGAIHLDSCKGIANAFQFEKKLEEGHLLQISWVEEPAMYWMIAAAANSLTMGDLDQFLRDEWVECCSHLSAFKIEKELYLSLNEITEPHSFMEKKMGEVLSPGLRFDYIYDMGSSTRLIIKVARTFVRCPQKNIRVLMQNNLPPFVCETCGKKGEVICCLCRETTCKLCSDKHGCVKQQGDAYMLRPLVNSPRTGVCGYEGKTLTVR